MEKSLRFPKRGRKYSEPYQYSSLGRLAMIER